MRFLDPIQRAFQALLSALERVGDILQEQAETTNKYRASRQERSPDPPVVHAVLEIPQSIIAKHETDADETQKREEKKLVWERATFWVVLAYTTVAAVYTTAAALQWCEMRRSIETSRDAMHRQLRAYMIYADGKVDRDGNVFVNFKNVGQTPAYATRSWWTYAFISVPTEESIHQGDLNRFAIGKIGELTLDIGGSGTSYPLQDRDFRPPVNQT